jgi:hypothetical protein
VLDAEGGEDCMLGIIGGKEKAPLTKMQRIIESAFDVRLSQPLLLILNALASSHSSVRPSDAVLCCSLLCCAMRVSSSESRAGEQ